MISQPTILLTNDDGFDAPGLRALHAALSRHFIVIVAAPQSEQSGIGHAFTFNKPLTYLPLCDLQGYAINGTPADCVKFAVSTLLTARPSLVISGMNRGENSGISGFYSGTLAGAREGAFWKIPSFAFSLCDCSMRYLDYYAAIAATMATQFCALPVAQQNAMTSGIYYNINFPDCAPDLCRGIKMTRQSNAFFDDRYELREASLAGATGYWVYGHKQNIEPSDEYDSRALISNYITCTPLTLDATYYGNAILQEPWTTISTPSTGF